MVWRGGDAEPPSLGAAGSPVLGHLGSVYHGDTSKEGERSSASRRGVFTVILAEGEGKM